MEESRNNPIPVLILAGARYRMPDNWDLGPFSRKHYTSVYRVGSRVAPVRWRHAALQRPCLIDASAGARPHIDRKGARWRFLN